MCNRPGTNVSEAPLHKPGDHYTSNTYGQAVMRGCDLAFPPPPSLSKKALPDGTMETHAQFMARLKPAQKAALLAWKKEHRWHPHQLRHTAATNIRRQFGLEAAQLVLGHASSKITDAIYAERDLGKIADIAPGPGWKSFFTCSGNT